MQIIFDKKLVPELRERFIVLELDTVMQPELSEPIILYALIENVDINNIVNSNDIIEHHQILINAYKSSNWDVAESNANALKGTWGGELDEFYDLVLETVVKFRNSNEIWTGVRHTTPTEE